MKKSTRGRATTTVAPAEQAANDEHAMAEDDQVSISTSARCSLMHYALQLTEGVVTDSRTCCPRLISLADLSAPLRIPAALSPATAPSHAAP